MAQDLVIRQYDCQTETGVLIELKDTSNITNLIGRTLMYQHIKVKQILNLILF